jgi:hypothetical protein
MALDRFVQEILSGQNNRNWVVGPGGTPVSTGGIPNQGGIGTPYPGTGTPNPLTGGGTPQGTPSGSVPNPLSGGRGPGVSQPPPPPPPTTGAPNLGSAVQPNPAQPYPTTTPNAGVVNPLGANPLSGGSSTASPSGAAFKGGTPLAAPGAAAPDTKPTTNTPNTGAINPLGGNVGRRGSGAPSPAGGTPGQPTNTNTAAVDERGWLMLPDGSRLSHRHDPRIWGSSGTYNLPSYNPQTGEALEHVPANSPYWIVTQGQPDESGNAVTTARLRPEVLARLGGRVQIPQGGVGGYSEVKDPSKVTYDPEFGFLTTPDNIGVQDDANARRWGLAVMIALTAGTGALAMSTAGAAMGTGAAASGGAATVPGAIGTGTGVGVGTGLATAPAIGTGGAVGLGTINVTAPALAAGGGGSCYQCPC